MAKVHFLNEAVTVDAEPGSSLYDIARRAGINLFVGFWKDYHCGGRGRCLGAGCRVWVSECEPGAISPKRDLAERVRRSLRGSQRLACRARVDGACEVRTLPTAVECEPTTTWEPDPRPTRWRERLAQPRAGKSTPVTAELAIPAGAGRVPHERVGTVIAKRYRICELIGAGGMGVVFLAEHIHLRRRVAIKLMHRAAMLFPEVSERFEREAVAIGRIAHPNCVGISDFGRLEDGSLYLVMELVDGRCLADDIDRGGPMPWRRALHIARHIAAGIGHAHDAGVVHRDIKPDNILLTRRGADRDFAKIVDFGIAKLAPTVMTETGLRPITQQGVAFGTPEYMSPEQAGAEPVDPRTDLYSVAVVTYEMIAGRAPFVADTGLKVLMMQRQSAVPPLSSFPLAEPVPADVEGMLRTGLAKNSRHRFQTAAAFVCAIDACLDERAARASGR